MRRVMRGMIWLLFALAIFLLGGTLIAACLGYTFKVAGIPDFVVIMGAFKNMQIHWKDDGCLVINSVEYKIE